MHIHILQHVDFEGAGVIPRWASENNHPVSYTRFYEQQWSLPEPDNLDLLVVMGGPMGVYDDDKYPWLASEKEFIGRTIAGKKKVLGICLGAQLIASVLGARVSKNKYKEIGWWNVAWNRDAIGKTILKGAALPSTVFHWHGDTFEIPENAERIAANEGCANQAFIYDNRVLGLQFHMEMTESDIMRISEECSAELAETGKFIQSSNQIHLGMDNVKLSNQSMYSMLQLLV